MRKLHLVSDAFSSPGHGLNDVQNTMGIIAILLINTKIIQTTSINDFPVEEWVLIPWHTAIAIGTIFNDWRIVKTIR